MTDSSKPKGEAPRRVRTPPGRASLGAAQAQLEADVAALGERLEVLKRQLAERRSLDAAVTALITLSKRRPKAKSKTTGRRKIDR